MTLIEIVQDARPGDLFKHGDDATEFYFDNDGEFMVRVIKMEILHTRINKKICFLSNGVLSGKTLV